MEQEPSEVADELSAHPGRDVGERDGSRIRVALKKVQLVREVSTEVGLVARQRRLDPRGIGTADRPKEIDEPAAQRPQLEARPVAGRFGHGNVDAPPERLQRPRDAADDYWRRRADPKRRDQRPDVADDLRFRDLLVGDEEQCGVDARHRRQPFKRIALLLELGQRPRRRQCRIARTAVCIHDLSLPDHGLRATSLEVEQVVVESHQAR